MKDDKYVRILEDGALTKIVVDPSILVANSEIMNSVVQINLAIQEVTLAGDLLNDVATNALKNYGFSVGDRKAAELATANWLQAKLRLAAALK